MAKTSLRLIAAFLPLLLTLGALQVEPSERKPTGRFFSAQGSSEASLQQDTTMDYGPALTYELDGTRSALILPLADSVHLYYDLHTMTVPAVWTGGFINLSKTHHTEYKGNERARITGDKLGLGPLAWAHDGSFDDPREGAEKLGPIPEEDVAYRGHYLHGDDVVLSYAVSGRPVLDQPAAQWTGGLPVVTHTLRVGPGEKALTLSLGRRRNPAHAFRQPVGGSRKPAAGPAEGSLLFSGTDTLLAAGVAGATAGTRWEVDEAGRLLLHLPARSEPMLLKVFRTAGHHPERMRRELTRLVAATKEIKDPSELTGGGPGRWNKTLSTTGTLGSEEGAYAVDQLALPFDNPWSSWMRPTALDFFADGRGVVTTLNGDVWIVSGIDKSLGELSWRRYATGLYEPLGVKIKDGTIYVQGRDRITRLHDENGDGEADYYESFHAFDHVSRGYHAFAFGLDTDSEGAFYTAKSGRKTDYPLPGAVLRITPDGEESEVVATGFRHPNGLAVGPQDRLFISDNQGDWIPASKLSYVQPGGFYGYPGWEEKMELRDRFHRPVFWLPQVADNSSGGPLWVEDERWGPLADRLIHTSYGAGQAFYTSLQEVDGVLQGTAVPFPWQFPSGLMRARVNPKDGQVYLVGQKGWGTRGLKDGSLSRIRYTGRPAYLLLEAGATQKGIRLRFSSRLDPSIAADTSRYAVRRWNYRWTGNYGSPHFLPGSDEKGEEDVQVQSVDLDADGHVVSLTLADHQPVDQMRVDLDLRTADGTPLQQTFYMTIKRIPE